MGQFTAQTPIDYMVVVGDNFYKHGLDSVGSYRWADTFEDVYAAASLQVPWHVIAGNHDQFCVGGARAFLRCCTR